MVRSMWTFHNDLPCYGPNGVSGGINEAITAMTKLSVLLKSHQVQFSVGVYPWPDQITSDTVNSQQVKIWQEWCKKSGCYKFINHFPDFFALKSDGQPWPKDHFLPGDAHFNEKGNQLIADKIIDTFSE